MSKFVVFRAPAFVPLTSRATKKRVGRRYRFEICYSRKMEPATALQDRRACEYECGPSVPGKGGKGLVSLHVLEKFQVYVVLETSGIAEHSSKTAKCQKIINKSCQIAPESNSKVIPL